jgi:hypothetical protein
MFAKNSSENKVTQEGSAANLVQIGRDYISHIRYNISNRNWHLVILALAPFLILGFLSANAGFKVGKVVENQRSMPAPKTAQTPTVKPESEIVAKQTTQASSKQLPRSGKDWLEVKDGVFLTIKNVKLRENDGIGWIDFTLVAENKTSNTEQIKVEFEIYVDNANDCLSSHSNDYKSRKNNITTYHLSTICTDAEGKTAVIEITKINGRLINNFERRFTFPRKN